MMKKSEQNEAMHLLKLAQETIAELLPLAEDRLNTDEGSLKLTQRDVARMIARIKSFREEFTD